MIAQAQLCVHCAEQTQADLVCGHRACGRLGRPTHAHCAGMVPPQHCSIWLLIPPAYPCQTCTALQVLAVPFLRQHTSCKGPAGVQTVVMQSSMASPRAANQYRSVLLFSDIGLGWQGCEQALSIVAHGCCAAVCCCSCRRASSGVACRWRRCVSTSSARVPARM